MSEASTPTTEAPAEKVDHEAIVGQSFLAASKAFANGAIPEAEATAVAETFRAVPSAARSKVQGLALKAVLTGGGNPEAVEAILDITNNLPKATSSGRTKVEVSPLESATVQAAALLVAYAEVTSDPEIGAEAAAAASDLYTNGIPEGDSRRDPILRAAAAAVKASTRKGGGGGARASFKETLTDLVNRGDLKTGDKLVGAGDAKATIAKDAKVRVGTGDTAQVFDNLSAAARHAKGGDKSVNGWDFWTVEVDGKPVPVGTLRQA